MIKVFIIGNGFDLAHGFQTRYTDFIKDYQNNISEEVLNRINSSKHNYEGNLINFKR